MLVCYTFYQCENNKLSSNLIIKQDILIIGRNFPPITGGIEKLMWNVFLNFSQHHQITFIGPKGSAAYIDAPYRCIECDEESPLRFLLQAAYVGWKASTGSFKKLSSVFLS